MALPATNKMESPERREGVSPGTAGGFSAEQVPGRAWRQGAARPLSVERCQATLEAFSRAAWPPVPPGRQAAHDGSRRLQFLRPVEPGEAPVEGSQREMTGFARQLEHQTVGKA